MNKNLLLGMRCPKCKSEEPFIITASATIWVYDDGTGDVDDMEWDEENHCRCVNCKYLGGVGDFVEEGSDE